MAKVKYTIKENKSIEPSLMRAAVAEYMKAVKRNVLKGFRCAVGEQFIYVYPNLEASLKDKKDAQGNIIEVAKIEDFTLAGAKSRLGATVSKKYSAQFAADVSWQRVDASGAAIDEEDIVDDGGDTPTPTPDPSTGGGDNNGGGGSSDSDES